MRDIFNSDRVLVRAIDLLVAGHARQFIPRAPVSYYNVALDGNASLFANGKQLSTFHPLDPQSPDPENLKSFVNAVPECAENPDVFGPYCQRALVQGEASILLGMHTLSH